MLKVCQFGHHLSRMYAPPFLSGQERTTFRSIEKFECDNVSRRYEQGDCQSCVVSRALRRRREAGYLGAQGFQREAPERNHEASQGVWFLLCAGRFYSQPMPAYYWSSSSSGNGSAPLGNSRGSGRTFTGFDKVSPSTVSRTVYSPGCKPCGPRAEPAASLCGAAAPAG